MLASHLPMLQGPFQDNLRSVSTDFLRDALHDGILEDQVLHVPHFQPLRPQCAVALQVTESFELCSQKAGLHKCPLPETHCLQAAVLLKFL